MDQGDESPLFCRHDTPPRSGVPPGYVSIRPLLLQRQQSVSVQQDQYSAESEEEAFQSPGQARLPNEGGHGRSRSLIDFDDGFVDHGNDSASTVTEIDHVQYTSLPSFLDRSATQSYDVRENAALDEGQVSPDDSLTESLEPSDGQYEQTVEDAQPQRGPFGDESPLFCRENTPPRSGVPPDYRPLRPFMGSRARRSRSPVAQHLPGLPETSHGLDTQHRQSARVYTATQHSSFNPLAPFQTTPLRPQPRPRPIPASQTTFTPSAAQQRPILPYVFQPSSVPQTPMESTLAVPLITKGEARSGTAVYPKLSPVTTTTAEGLYTLTDAQVYWNSRGRPQCFKLNCDNNQSIGYSSEVSRDEHITNTRYHSQIPHLGYEQNKRGYQNGRDYPLL
ncbi:hypothetical protein KCU85_g7509, partial [Aureobasidium melanogenum]